MVEKFALVWSTSVIELDHFFCPKNSLLLPYFCQIRPFYLGYITLIYPFCRHFP